VQLRHIPYKGGSPALTDLLGGQIPMLFDPIPTSIKHANGGRIKVLAISSAARVAAAPNVPTVSESGLPGYSAVGWFGLFAPTGTPKPVVQKINQAVMATMAQGKIRKAMMDRGSDPASGSPEDFSAFLRVDQAKWSKLIKENRIAVQ
jgi:tripartite-type tricarboxylate transporter receptor subunit TctC